MARPASASIKEILEQKSPRREIPKIVASALSPAGPRGRQDALVASLSKVRRGVPSEPVPPRPVTTPRAKPAPSHGVTFSARTLVRVAPPLGTLNAAPNSALRPVPPRPLAYREKLTLVGASPVTAPLGDYKELLALSIRSGRSDRAALSAYNSGMLLSNGDRHAAAARALEEALLHARDADLLLAEAAIAGCLAVEYAFLGRYDEAEECCQLQLSIEAETAPLFRVIGENNIGLIRLYSGRPADAVRSFQTALSACADSPFGASEDVRENASNSVRSNLAIAFTAAGLMKEAKRVLMSAAEASSFITVNERTILPILPLDRSTTPVSRPDSGMSPVLRSLDESVPQRSFSRRSSSAEMSDIYDTKETFSLLGTVAQSAGDSETAKQHFTAASQVAAVTAPAGASCEVIAERCRSATVSMRQSLSYELDRIGREADLL